MMTTTLRLWLALRLVSPVFSSPRVSSAHTLLRLVPSTRSRSFAGNGLGFFGRNPKGSSSRPPASTCRDVSACGKIAVLFDFDGTIGKKGFLNPTVSFTVFAHWIRSWDGNEGHVDEC
eukprot:140670-Amorphochlora_amoeboformis.AAC.1